MPRKPKGKVAPSSASNVVFEETVDERPDGQSSIAFVNLTGPATKNRQVQRSIRNFVMRDHGKARRRPGRGGEKAEISELVPAVPKLTVVADASPEYYQSVQLVKATRRLQIAAPEDAEMQPSDNSDLVDDVDADGFDEDAQGVAPQDAYTPGISRFSAGRIDPFIRYPIEMTPRVRRLVDHVFTDTPERNIKFYRDTIFPQGLIGDISFRQVLSNLALYLRHARPLEAAKDYEIREELAHQTRVFKLVNDKIAKTEATSDDVISAVAALACQSHVARDMRMFHVHMGGLKAIIRMRGGVQTLDSNTLVRHSIYWLDANGNSTEDLTPNYPIPTRLVSFRPDLPLTIHVPQITETFLATWHHLYPHQSEFHDLVSDTARFAVHLAAEEKRTAGHIYTDVYVAGNILIGLVHRLLSAREATDGENPATVVREVMRLGMLLFLAEVRRRFGLHPIDSRVHVRKLKTVLQLGRGVPDIADPSSLTSSFSTIPSMTVSASLSSALAISSSSGAATAGQPPTNTMGDPQVTIKTTSAPTTSKTPLPTPILPPPLHLWTLALALLEAVEAQETEQSFQAQAQQMPQNQTQAQAPGLRAHQASLDDQDSTILYLKSEWTRSSINHGITSAAQAEGLFRDVMWVDSVHGVLFRKMEHRFFVGGRRLAPKVG